MELFEDIEVDSVIDLQLLVGADVLISAEAVGEQLAPKFMARSWVEPLCGAEARDPGVVPHVSSMAGTGEHYEHVVWMARSPSALSSK